MHFSSYVPVQMKTSALVVVNTIWRCRWNEGCFACFLCISIDKKIIDFILCTFCFVFVMLCVGHWCISKNVLIEISLWFFNCNISCVSLSLSAYARTKGTLISKFRFWYPAAACISNELYSNRWKCALFGDCTQQPCKAERQTIFVRIFIDIWFQRFPLTQFQFTNGK